MVNLYMYKGTSKIVKKKTVGLKEIKFCIALHDRFMKELHDWLHEKLAGNIVFKINGCDWLI